MEMDENTRGVVESAYDETVEEARGRGLSELEAHKEGVVSASMILAAMVGCDHEEAKSHVVGMNLRPKSD
jgi:hypothetical protein